MCLIACLFTSLNCTEKCSSFGCQISVSPPFMRQPSLSRAMKCFVLFAAGIVTSSVSNKVPGDRPSISRKDLYLTLIRQQHPNSTFWGRKGHSSDLEASSEMTKPKPAIILQTRYMPSARISLTFHLNADSFLQVSSQELLNDRKRDISATHRPVFAVHLYLLCLIDQRYHYLLYSAISLTRFSLANF